MTERRQTLDLSAAGDDVGGAPSASGRVGNGFDSTSEVILLRLY